MADSLDDLDHMLPAFGPSPYHDTWDRHNSIAFSATKGLRNAPGENNCFVNCAVQVFWHLDVFRRSYRRLLGHACMGNSCIFCALKVIFTQFQYSDKSSLHPDALRKALAETFANQQRFQLGHMDDAAECFENILRRIHWHITCGHSEDACTAPHCLPHQKFSMQIYEKVVCPCGASSSPLRYSEMVHYVSSSALIAQSRMMKETGDSLHPERFGLLLRRASAMGDVRNCPANCGKQVQKQRTLLNIPDVVSVGLVWDSDHPSIETTTEVAAALGTAIHLADMYHKVNQDVRILPRLQLVAVVCYYGKHYSTFVFHSKLKTWMYFDDATVRQIGPAWENVVDKCSKGRFQPLLLLYANPSAVPVNVDSAPRKKVMVQGYAPVNGSEEAEGGLDKTQDSIKSSTVGGRRSTTPSLGLEPKDQTLRHGAEVAGLQENGRDSPARLSREHSRQPSFLFAVTGKNDKHNMNGGIKTGEEAASGSGLTGGTAAFYPGARRQTHDGGAIGKQLEVMTERAGDYADYTLSGGNQYRRPSLNGALEGAPMPVPPNNSRHPDTQRKDSFTKRSASKEKGVDVVRYQVDQPSRTRSRTPDFTLESGGFSQSQQGKVPGHHGRQRSLSSGIDEDEGIEMSSISHVVLKPRPTGHTSYDMVDSSGHTAIQSGLATLPRHKGMHQTHSADSLVSYAAHQSSNQEVAMINRKSNLQPKPVDPPLPPGTPPPEYNSLPHDSSQPHSRQASVSSQASTIKGGMSTTPSVSPIKSAVSMGHLDMAGRKEESGKEKEKSKKKGKKEKKDKDKEGSSKKSSDKKKSKAEAALKKCDSESDLLADKDQSYINRHMVESILKSQGVQRVGSGVSGVCGVNIQRQNSSCSSSSLDSDCLLSKVRAAKGGNLTVDTAFDSMSLSSQKDSGYGSSDRNSSSSTGSGTIDPCTQYFISKSMVVPRNVMMHNAYNMMDQQQYHKGHSDPFGGQGHHSISHTNGQRDDGRIIMHPIRESSQEDMLKIFPNEPIGTQKFIIANAAVPPSECRPPPVPPKNFAQFQIIKSSQANHERESSLDSLDKDDSVSDQFVSLCKKSDSLMDSCMLAETQTDIASAINYCNSALGCLKEAMGYKDLTSKALTYVQKKHNSCLLKLRSLQKRLAPARQESHSSGIGSDAPSSGNRSSITSSDSDMSDQLPRQLRLDGGDKQVPSMQYRQDPSPTFRAAHERQNSSSRVTGMDGSPGAPLSGMQGQKPPGQAALTDRTGIGYHQRQDSSGAVSVGPVPHSHSANYLHQGTVSSGGSSSSGCSPEDAGSHADMYGTLPRNKSRKPSSEMAAAPEVYQSFLHKQKCLQAGVGASQQSLDSLQSDSSSEKSSNSNGSSSKMSRADIQQLLQDKFAPRPGRQHPLPTQLPASTQQQQQQQVQQFPHPQPPLFQQQQQHQYYNPPDVRPNGQTQFALVPRPNLSVQTLGQNYASQQGQQKPPPSQQTQQPAQNQHPVYQQQLYGQQQQSYSQQQQYQPQTQYQQQKTQSYQPCQPVQHYNDQSQPSQRSHLEQRQQPAMAFSSLPSAQPPSVSSLGQKPSLPAYRSSAAQGLLSASPLQQQQQQSQQQQHQQQQHQQQQQQQQVHYSGLQRSESSSGEVGKRVVHAAPSVARVAPNSHMAVATNGGNYLVMMPSSSTLPAASSATPKVAGGPLKLATSTAHLGPMPLTLTPGVRPLERCASQPDCQKIVESASSCLVNLPDEGGNSYMSSFIHPRISPLPFSHSADRLNTGETDTTQTAMSLDGVDSASVSVRALLSRFEKASVGAGQSPGSQPGSRGNSFRRDNNDFPPAAAALPRTRSKSESFSRKPRSVLKNKKNKARPRKSVTFADSIAHYAADDASGYESAWEQSAPRLALDDRAYHSDDEDRFISHASYSDNDLDDAEDTGSSNSDETPLGEDEQACQLCSKRRVDGSKVFCAKCSFYMGKLKPS